VRRQPYQLGNEITSRDLLWKRLTHHPGKPHERLPVDQRQARFLVYSAKRFAVLRLNDMVYVRSDDLATLACGYELAHFVEGLPRGQCVCVDRA
jgi:hypothetical protein